MLSCPKLNPMQIIGLKATKIPFSLWMGDVSGVRVVLGDEVCCRRINRLNIKLLLRKYRYA